MSEDGGDAPERSGPPVGVWVGLGVAVLAGIGGFALFGGPGQEEPPSAVPIGGAGAGGGPGATAGAGPGGGPAAGTELPDVAAWKTLGAAQRAEWVDRLISEGSGGDEAAFARSVALLKGRGEDSAVKRLARAHLSLHEGCSAASEVVGRVEVMGEINEAFGKCEIARDVEVPPVLELLHLQEKHGGRKSEWFAEGEDLVTVRRLIAETYEAEKELDSDAAYGRAKWVRYQRTIPVMEDFPSVYGHVGPYLIFAQISDPKSKFLYECDPEQVERARGVLKRNIALYAALYEGWHENLAPLFGFKRYGEDDVDQKTILKVNVFGREADYDSYNRQVRRGAGARAYYSLVEPRFVITYEGTKEKKDENEIVFRTPEEERAYTDQVQCHEGTHQLVHFYTWDTARKAIGKEPEWLAVKAQPAWSTEGFAEFFSSHTKDAAGNYEWMQPLEDRLSDLWILGEIRDEHAWETFRLDELLRIRHGGQLQLSARARARAGQEGLAITVMSNLFYAEAWSMMYFLWYEEEGGRPKYRDHLVEYLKREFEPDFGQRSGRPIGEGALLVTEKDFYEVFGLEDDAAKAAFAAEWRAYYAKLVETHRKPRWAEKRSKLRKLYRLDD